MIHSMVIREKPASKKPPIQSSTNFNDFGMSRPGIEPVTSRSQKRTLYKLRYQGWFDLLSYMINVHIQIEPQHD